MCVVSVYSVKKWVDSFELLHIHKTIETLNVNI